jgi:hypothetical protein
MIDEAITERPPMSTASADARQHGEAEGRRWVAFELNMDYIAPSVFRFLPEDCSESDFRRAYHAVQSGQTFFVAPAAAGQIEFLG